MSEYRFKFGDFAPTGIGWPRNPQFQVEGVASTNHSFSQVTKLYVLSYSIKIPVLSQSTRLTDGQIIRQTEFSSMDRVCIPCSAVKTKFKVYDNGYRRVSKKKICIVLFFGDNVLQISSILINFYHTSTPSNFATKWYQNHQYRLNNVFIIPRKT